MTDRAAPEPAAGRSPRLHTPASRWSRWIGRTVKPVTDEGSPTQWTRSKPHARTRWTAQGAAKSRDGKVEAIRALMVAKRSARSERIKTINQIRHLSFSAPEEMRARYKDISSRQGMATEVARAASASWR